MNNSARLLLPEARSFSFKVSAMTNIADKNDCFIYTHIYVTFIVVKIILHG